MLNTLPVIVTVVLLVAFSVQLFYNNEALKLDKQGGDGHLELIMSYGVSGIAIVALLAHVIVSVLFQVRGGTIVSWVRPLLSMFITAAAITNLALVYAANAKFSAAQKPENLFGGLVSAINWIVLISAFALLFSDLLDAKFNRKPINTSLQALQINEVPPM